MLGFVCSALGASAPGRPDSDRPQGILTADLDLPERTPREQ